MPESSTIWLLLVGSAAFRERTRAKSTIWSWSFAFVSP